MAIYSGSGVITDSADGTFSDGSVETLKIGAPALEFAVMQGSVSLFVSGGYLNPSIFGTQIDKFPIAISSGTSTDTGGDLSVGRYGLSGHSSSDDGFNTGGYQTGFNYSTVMEKFPFAITSGTSTPIGNLTIASSFSSSHSSPTDGFTAGGDPSSGGIRIEKFPFSQTSGSATDVGDLSQQRRGLDGSSSTEEGFAMSGTFPSSTYFTTIDKFPFSISSGTATDVGDLNVGREFVFGNSSTTSGFSAGGFSSPGFGDASEIDKFPFAISSGTATDVGDLSETRGKGGAANSQTDGFCFGSSNGPPTNEEGIDKYPFSISSGTATSVGTLGTPTYSYPAGHQD